MARSPLMKKVTSASRVSNESYTGAGEGINPVTLDETIEGAGTVAALEAEYADIQAEMADADDIDQSQAQVSELADLVEAQAENGGIAVEQAALLAWMMPAIYQAEPVVGVSVESYNGGRSVTQSRVAVENLRETVKGWWAKLKETIKRIVGKLRKWWEGNWAAAPRLKARAEALRKNAGSKGTGTKEKDFESKALYESLAIGSGFGNVSNGLNTLESLVKSAFGTVQANGHKFVEKVTEVIGSADFSSDEKAKETLSKFTAVSADNGFAEMGKELGMKPVTGDRPESLSNIQDGFVLTRTDELPGGKAFYLTTPQTALPSPGASEDIGKSFRAITDTCYRFDVSLENYGKKAIDGEGKKVPVASRMEISGICDKVINIAQSIESYKKDFENQNRAQDSLDKAGDRLANAVGGNDDVKGTGTAISALHSVISYCTKILSEPATTFMKYTMRTANAAISYGESSLAKYDNK